jgi:hypothetical protein
MASSHPRSGLTRRGFLFGTATGFIAGLPLGAAGLAAYLRRGKPPFTDSSPEDTHPRYAMPGRYPGRVIEVRHPAAVSGANVIDSDVVSGMIDRGMAELVGCDPGDHSAAWGTFFQKGDVVGIKVNPVGRKPLPGEGGRNPNAVGSISSPAVLVKVVRCLRELGIPAKDIIVFERYASEFCEAGYKDLVERELPGVRWHASSIGYSDQQLDIAGFDGHRDNYAPEVARHVAGYDPDVFTSMGYCAPEHSKHDDRRFRSHLSLIVTRLVNKIITLPVLKDHRSAGVTLALKNLSHGMNNNVARSHLSGIAHGFGPGTEHVTGPNQCNTFIPQAVSQHALRQKATLHILDGLIGVYEGGPGCWNKTWATWRHKGLFFATDPVALDHVGWDLINAERARHGWAPVERMGWLYQTPEVHVASNLAPLAGHGLLDATALALAARNLEDGRATESFNVRQPDHIVLAGQLGLGVFPRNEIHYRCVQC